MRIAIVSDAWRPQINGVVRTIDDILYCNDGDWVESCTALVEDFDGRLRIVRWAEETAREQSVLRPYTPARLAAE